MTSLRPLFDEYWDEKQINPANIRDIPMYLTASYSTGLHCEGSFHAFETAQTARKWLRVHASQEWHDLYRSEAIDDLQRFFDFYAKGVQIGWEEDTPRVRLSLLGYDGSYAKTVVERPEQEWPPARQNLTRYYLDGSSQSLVKAKPNAAASVTHEGHSLDDSSVCSNLDIIKYDCLLTASDSLYRTLHYISTNIPRFAVGPLRKSLSCDEADDFDVVVQLRKISSSGELLESLNWLPMPKPPAEVPNVNVAKHIGQQGMLRASHHVSLEPRESDNEVSRYNHKSRQAITPGSVVPLLIPIWPAGMVFQAGEGLMLRISGHDMAHPETESLRVTRPVDENRGKHTVYTGGDRESYLVIPVITE
ncbi:hypothetical protein VI817_001956 [Penicillium citrinum]|nr:hypothetical protein VI817_001956 [Penicillium citrinum]